MFPYTFYQLLGGDKDRRGDRTLVVDGDRNWTYTQVAQEVERVAAWLIKAGVQRGDRVAIHMQKSLAEIVGMFATSKIGAVFVNVNHQWTSHQLEYVLKDCNVCALIIDSRAAAGLVDIDRPESLRAVLVNGECHDAQDTDSWSNLEHSPTPTEAIGIDTDLAALLYTSGSTGQPKGVMLTHRNIIEGARSVADYLDNHPDDRLLSLLPFSFDYGLSQLTTMCLVGGSVVLQRIAMASEIVRTLVDQRVTGLALVPPMWIHVIRLLEQAETRLPYLRFVTNSGGKIPDPILELMPKVMPDTDIVLMYGLTEAFRSTYLPPALFDSYRGAIGQSIPNAETYIIKNDGIAGPGEQGELVHRGAHVSLGYWGKPDATAEKIKPCPQLAHLIGDEKVCYSGDLVRIDDNGCYWFVSRMDAMLKVSGFRISPNEIEDAVSRSGLVGHVVAFGRNDEINGQVVEVAITAPDDGPVDTAALLKYCRATMPNYMVPQNIHGWHGKMPRTSSGKLDRPTIIKECLKLSE